MRKFLSTFGTIIIWSIFLWIGLQNPVFMYENTVFAATRSITVTSPTQTSYGTWPSSIPVRWTLQNWAPTHTGVTAFVTIGKLSTNPVGRNIFELSGSGGGGLVTIGSGAKNISVPCGWPSGRYRIKVCADGGSGEVCGSSVDFNLPAGSPVCPDTTAPRIIGGSPTGALSNNVDPLTLTVVTDENATCKYGTTPNITYASIAHTFSTTGGTIHTSSVSGLRGGINYQYYVRCQDQKGNTSFSDHTISFSIVCPQGTNGTYPSCVCNDTAKTYSQTTKTCNLTAACPHGYSNIYTWRSNMYVVPQGTLLYKMAASADGSKLIGSVAGGALYASVDSGMTWALKSVPGVQNFHGLASSADGTQFALGAWNNYLYTSNNSGTTWAQQTSAGTGYWHDITSSSNGTKLAAITLWDGAIFTSSNSGSTWAKHKVSEQRRDFWYITSSSDGEKIFAIATCGTGGSCLYSSLDGGDTWREHVFTFNEIYATYNHGINYIASSADGTKLVANGRGNIHTSSDSGVTWTERLGPWDPQQTNWDSIASSADGMTLFAGTNNGLIYISTDAGLTWAAQTNFGSHVGGYGIVSTANGERVFVANDNDLYIGEASCLACPTSTTGNYPSCVCTDTTKQYQSSTNTCIPKPCPTGTTGTGQPNCTCSDTTKTYNPTTNTCVPKATCANGSTETYTWAERTSAGKKWWLDVASSGSGEKLAAIAYLDNKIYTSNNYGSTWVQQTITNGPSYFYSIASSVNGDKLVAFGINGDIYVSSNSGISWSKTGSTNIFQGGFVASSTSGEKLAVATNSGYIYTSTNSGSSWTAQTTSGMKPWKGITSSANGEKLAAIAWNESIYTSTNSGVTWTGRPSSGQKDWIDIASSSDGTKLIAVARNDFIYISTDSGETWVPQTVLGPKNWHSVASSSDGTRLVAVVSGGYIYLSNNSGITWAEQTSAGQKSWYSIVSSLDGTKFALTTYSGAVAGQSPNNSIYIGTSSCQTCPAEAPLSPTTNQCVCTDSAKTYDPITNTCIDCSVYNTSNSTNTGNGGTQGNVVSVSTTPGCLDSDGLDYYTKGYRTIQGISEVNYGQDYDFCSTGTYCSTGGSSCATGEYGYHPGDLVEYRCLPFGATTRNGTGICNVSYGCLDWVGHTCPNGCQDGACKPDSGTSTNIGATGGNTGATGDTTNIPAICQKTCPTGSTGTYPNDCHCTQTNYKYDPATNTCVDCTPPTTTPTTTCIDNDGGIDYTLKTKAYIFQNGAIIKSAEDTCISASSLKEITCASSSASDVTETIVSCTCLNGACTGGQVSYVSDDNSLYNCSDSDGGGAYYYTRGTTAGLPDGSSFYDPPNGSTTGSFTDSCRNNLELSEYSCTGTNGVTYVDIINGITTTWYFVGRTIFTCPYGCSNGACNLPPDPPPAPGVTGGTGATTPLPTICTQTCPTEAPLNTTTNKCVCTNTAKTYNTTTRTCNFVCPADTINTYPVCKCTDATKDYQISTNTCVTKSCPTGATNTYPSCDCSPLGKQYSQMTNTCTGGCVQTQAPSQLQANLDQPLITCRGDSTHPEYTHFKYRLTKEGSTNATDTFTSSTSKAIGTYFIHPALSAGTYTVQCFYGTETQVNTTTAPDTCTQTIIVTSEANSSQGCRRIYPYKGTTLSDEMIHENSFQASFRCGSRLPLAETITNPYLFSIEGQDTIFRPFDTLISELFNGLEIGPVSTQTQNYSFGNGTTPVSCAVKVGNGYSTSSSCQLNTCVGENCSNPKSFAVFSGDAQCTSHQESSYNIGCNPESSDFTQCVQGIRDVLAQQHGTMVAGTEYPMMMKFGGPASPDTRVLCTEYRDVQTLPEDIKKQFSENNDFPEQGIIICKAELTSGETVQIYAADTSGRSFQTSMRTRELDANPPRLTDVAYYTNDSLSTEVSNEYYFNKPVTAVAICSDTPANEDMYCSCSSTVHTSTTNADEWSRGIPNNIIGADLMRYTRRISQTIENEYVTLADTAENVSTTEPISFFIDTEKPMITLSGTAVTTGTNAGSLTITAQDAISHIWSTPATPGVTADTPAALNKNGILYRIGSKNDQYALAFDENCDLGSTITPSPYAKKVDIDADVVPEQVDTDTAITILPNQILSYCVKDNAGNVAKGFFPRETDSCFAASNLSTIPDFTTHKGLTKDTIESTTNTDIQKYGYTFSENTTNAACFRTLLNYNIETRIVSQYVPIQDQYVLSNWNASLAKIRSTDDVNPGQPNSEGYYYYDYTNATNKTLAIVTSPSGTGQKAVIVAGGDIKITQNIIYSTVSGASHTYTDNNSLLLIAKKDNDGRGGNIEITPNVTRIDAILIADGGAIISGDPINSGDRLIINGRMYSYNTRGGSYTVDPATDELVNATTPKIFINGTLTDTNITLEQAQKQDLEHFRTIDIDGTNTCSLYLDYYNFTTDTLPPLLRRPDNEGGIGQFGECSFGN